MIAGQRYERIILWLTFQFFLLVGCTNSSNPPPLLPTIISVATTPYSQATVTATAVPQTFPPLPTPSPISPPTTVPLTPTPTVTAVPPTWTPTRCPPGQVITGIFPSKLTGSSNYRVYLPPCYGIDGRGYPTLYLFSGNSQDENAWDNYGLDEAAESAIQNQTIPPLLIVMVDGGWIANNSSGGPNSYEGHIINNLVPFIEQIYCAWPETAGRAIGGLSRGGYWSLEIAFRHPQKFASVGGHSPALIDSHAGPEINPQDTALTNDLTGLRIYLDIGADDYLLPNTLRLHEEMQAANIPHTWKLNEGAHDDNYWPQHLTEYLTWYTQPWSFNRNTYPHQSCSSP
ncbi:MAG: esterase family protein [Chloroflexi bacterium]|nr:esterase family protein [Chloroflexota bacterium]